MVISAVQLGRELRADLLVWVMRKSWLFARGGFHPLRQDNRSKVGRCRGRLCSGYRMLRNACYRYSAPETLKWTDRVLLSLILRLLSREVPASVVRRALGYWFWILRSPHA
jgi:hypothetical protein